METRRRICPPRVHVDLDLVQRRQAEGATLAAIAGELGVGRATVARRLARWRRTMEREHSSGLRLDEKH